MTEHQRATNNPSTGLFHYWAWLAAGGNRTF